MLTSSCLTTTEQYGKKLQEFFFVRCYDYGADKDYKMYYVNKAKIVQLLQNLGY
jgi:hypothetical protein